jgi:CO/xanthine dehydrogenase FAD-binding subunit
VDVNRRGNSCCRVHSQEVRSECGYATAVELPPPAAGRSVYRKVRERAAFAFVLVSAAALLDIAGDGTIRNCQLALR